MKINVKILYFFYAIVLLNCNNTNALDDGGDGSKNKIVMLESDYKAVEEYNKLQDTDFIKDYKSSLNFAKKYPKSYQTPELGKYFQVRNMIKEAEEIYQTCIQTIKNNEIGTQVLNLHKYLAECEFEKGDAKSINKEIEWFKNNKSLYPVSGYTFQNSIEENIVYLNMLKNLSSIKVSLKSNENIILNEKEKTNDKSIIFKDEIKDIYLTAISSSNDDNIVSYYEKKQPMWSYEIKNQGKDIFFVQEAHLYNDNILIMCSKKNYYPRQINKCLEIDIKTGKLLKEISFPNADILIYKDSYIIFRSTRDIICYDLTENSINWDLQIDGSLNKLIVLGNDIIFPAEKYIKKENTNEISEMMTVLYRLSINTGKIMWKVEYPNEYYFEFSKEAQNNLLMIYSYADYDKLERSNRIKCINTDTGKPIWYKTFYNEGFRNFYIIKERVVFSGSNIFLFDLKSGELIKEFACDYGSNYLADENNVYFVNEYGVICASLDNSKIKWFFKLKLLERCGLFLVKNYVFLSCPGGYVLLFDKNDGTYMGDHQFFSENANSYIDNIMETDNNIKFSFEGNNIICNLEKQKGVPEFVNPFDEKNRIQMYLKTIKKASPDLFEGAENDLNASYMLVKYCYLLKKGLYSIPFEKKQILSDIIKKYPDTKSAALAAYLLNDYYLITEKYQDARFPKLVNFKSEFLMINDAWEHYMSGGSKMAPVAQQILAKGALGQKNTSKWEENNSSLEKIGNHYYYDIKISTDYASKRLKEQQKVISYYNKEIDSRNFVNILEPEWQTIILVSLFDIVSCNIALDNLSETEKICNDILTLPRKQFGNNYGKDSYFEAYLFLADIAKKKSNNALVFLYYEKILLSTDCSKYYWGYHGGSGESYYQTVIRMATEQNSILAKELFNKVYQKTADEIVKSRILFEIAWIDYKEGRKKEGTTEFKEYFSKYSPNYNIPTSPRQSYDGIEKIIQELKDEKK